ncbi:centromere protein U [Pantherophis guttatus]|uniref:Centromere protein U n=1 Tax=Pantherophis guttatus TaxID=94885 RepID=A0ABM3Z314_PANGU|nr:centromere protein U [Pantherophis guttatus]XP_060542760.1 centromere protein U [Pantherophis guttatus]
MSKRKATKNFKKKLAGCQAKQASHGKLFSSEEPDISRILKIPGTGLTEETDDLFDHPLHSTALSVYEEGEEADNGNDQYLTINESTSSSFDPEPPKKNTKKRKANTLKTIVRTEDSEEEPSVKNMIPKKKTQSDVNKNVLPEKETNCPVSKKVPKQPTKVTRCVTKEKVVLKEFEKITTEYKEEVEQEKYKNVIDKFHARLKDQFTDISADAEKLKNTKLNQTKIIRKTNKTRQRLIEIKGELFRNEPELKKLKKEHSKLKEKISCLKNAVQFIKDLKSLQQMKNEKENLQEKLRYSISSLPALLMESRRILGAESHLQNINTKLQESLELQKTN